MIKKPTVFVVGAGASAPFGFPTGDRLMREIAHGGRAVAVPQHKIPELAEEHRGQIERLRRALSEASPPSIDDFLEKRQDLLELGKVAIASCLVPRETHHKVCALEAIRKPVSAG